MDHARFNDVSRARKSEQTRPQTSCADLMSFSGMATEKALLSRVKCVLSLERQSDGAYDKIPRVGGV